jgi:hypothetical protein
MKRFLQNWSKRARKSKASKSLLFRPCLERLEERRVMDVSYHSGPVIAHVQVDDIYYGQDWANADIARSINLTNYVSTLAKSSYMSILGEYGVGEGRLDNAVYVTDGSAPTRGTTVTESQIQSVVANEINAGLVPQPDGSHVYAVFLPTNVVSQRDFRFYDPTKSDQTGSFLGHHNSFTLVQTHRQYSPYMGVWLYWQTQVQVPYIVMPTPGGSNPSGSLSSSWDQTTGTFSHELAETVTNPFPVVSPTPTWMWLGLGTNNVRIVPSYQTISNGTGWWEDGTGDEIGDIGKRLAQNGSYGYLDGYVVQKEWSTTFQASVIPAFDASGWLGTDPWGYTVAHINTAAQVTTWFYNSAASQWFSRNYHVSWGQQGVFFEWDIGPNDYSGWVSYAF